MQNTEAKYKNTEIGPVPEDWDLKEFQDISFMKGRIGWQGLNQNEFNMKIDDPFLITGMNFKDGQIRWHEVYHISEERYQIAKEIQLRKDDVLITKDGTIGKLLYIDNIPYPYKASLNSHLLVFRPLKNSYIPKFLYYQLSSKLFKDYIELIKYGTTFFGISQEGIGKYKVILPSLTEQKAIATALSDTDALLSSLEQLIAKKRAIKQGAMQELLKPKEGWEVKKLGDIAEFSSGVAHENHVSSLGKFTLVNSKFISTEANIKKFTNYLLCPARKNDILIVLSDVPNGRAIAKCFLVKHDNKYTVNQRIGIIRTNQINTHFLYLIINRNPYFLSFDDGAKQTNLRNQDVLNFEFASPKSLNEQAFISTILSDMDTEIQNLEIKLHKYKQIKQGMMQQLLTGKIRLV